MKSKNDIVLVRNNPDLTKRIKELIGERVKCSKRIRNYYQNESSNYLEVYYVINWKFLITIYFNKETGDLLEDITIEDYKEKITEQKNFGMRVSHLANICKVPWNIAQLVGHITDDNLALITIEEIKKAKTTITKELIIELHSGRDSRLNAFKKILGNQLLKKIRLSDNRQEHALANFLSF